MSKRNRGKAMAGFKRNKVFVLNFLDEQFDGLKVEMKHATLEEYYAVMEQFDKKAETRADSLRDIHEAYEILADKFVSWNLEDDDDNPIPFTLENFKKQDREFCANLVGAWLAAVSGASRPLEKKLSDGEPPSSNGEPDRDELGLMSSISMTKPPSPPSD